METGKCFCRPAGVGSGEPEHDVEVSIAPDRVEAFRHVIPGPEAGRIAEKQWHAGQVVEPQPDGSLILRLHVNDLRLIKRWVMYRAAECEVLEPEELIAMVVSDLKAVGRIYRRARTR